jgi:hypothetical protein
MIRFLIVVAILMGSLHGCSDGDHEKIREEMSQIADQEESSQEIDL